MPDASYRHFYDAFGKEVLQADFMVADMQRRAQAILARGQEIAPVGDPETDPHSGRYKASFYIADEKLTGGKTKRAVGRVGNSSPDAVLVEYVDGHHTLAKALDAAAD
jgi:hypothetical protein